MKSPRPSRIGHVYPPRPKPAPVLRLPHHVNDFVVLPDGDTVVAACENDGTLLLVSLNEGTVDELAGHGMPVNSLALADAGRLLVSASDDATLRVWDIAERRTIAVLRGHEGFIRDVDAAGSVAVSGGEDDTLRVWDLKTGEQTAAFDDHEYSVDRVAVSPEGRRAASASRDNLILLWDLEKPSLERQLSGAGQQVFDLDVPFEGGDVYVLLGGNDSGVGHQHAPSALSFADGDTLYSAAENLIAWDVRDGTELSRSDSQPHEMSALARHPRLPLLVAPCLQRVGVFSLDGDRRYALGGGYPHETLVRFLGDGRLVSVDAGDVLKVWPPLTGDETDGMRHAGEARVIAVDPTSRFALSFSDSEAMLWDLGTGDRIAVIPGADTKRAEHTELFSPEGEHFVLEVDGEARLYPTSGATHTVIALDTDARPAALLPVGADRVFVIGENPYAEDPRAQWDPMLCDTDGRRRQRLQGRTSEVAAFRQVAHGGGSHVVTAGVLKHGHPLLDNPGDVKVSVFGIPTLQCWDLSAGQLVWTRHTDPAADIGRTSSGYRWVHTTGDTVLTHFGRGEDAELRLIDTGTGEVRSSIAIAESGILGRDPIPLNDHSVLFVGFSAEAVELWTLDLSTTELTKTATISTAGIDHVNVARPVHGQDLLLLLGKTALHCFRFSTGERVTTVDFVTQAGVLAATADGRTAIVGDDDGAVHILRLE